MTSRTRTLERRMGDAVRRALPPWTAEFALFVLKQGWACLFGGLMLGALIISRLVWQDDWPVHRYDALFLFALAVQAAFLTLRLETPREAAVIGLFHLTGTVMEWFKVAAGSWSYPDPAVLAVMDVPLFSGFMYASVGSYIVRVIRGFRMVFAPYPSLPATWALAAAIYGNFFWHHYFFDARLVLFAACVLLYRRTRVHFTVGRRYAMPLPLAALLAALALWVAENIGTLTGTWVYAGTARFDWASVSKMGSWFLLLHVSFVTVTLVVRAPLRAGVRGRGGLGRDHAACSHPWR